MYGYYENYSISHYCYLCLTCNNNLKPVYHRTEQSVMINTKIKYVLPEMISLDPMTLNPMFICNNCLVSLTSFYLFKGKCLENNKRLLEYVTKQKQTAVNTQTTQRTQQSYSQSTFPNRFISNTSRNLQTQATVLPIIRIERTQELQTATVDQNTHRNLEKRDTMLPSSVDESSRTTDSRTINQNGYKNLENGEQHLQTIKPATVIQNAQSNQEKQTTILPFNGNECTWSTEPRNCFQNVYQSIENEEQRSRIVYAYKNFENGEQCSQITKPSTVLQKTPNYPERQDTSLQSNGNEHIRATEQRTCFQNAYRNLENEEQRPQITKPSTVLQNTLNFPERQDTSLQSNGNERIRATEQRTCFQNAYRNLEKGEQRSQITKPSTVLQNTSNYPERQDTSLQYNGNEHIRATEQRTCFQNAYRNLENGEQRSQITKPSTVLQNTPNYPGKQDTDSQSNRNELIRATEQRRTCIQNAYRNLENGEQHIKITNPAKVFQNFQSNAERQVTVLPSNRDECIQATALRACFQNSYRNIENGEKRSQTTKPFTVFHKSHSNSERPINHLPSNADKRTHATESRTCYQNAYENLENGEKHSQTTKPSKVFQNILSNPERPDTILPSNGHESTRVTERSIQYQNAFRNFESGDQRLQTTMPITISQNSHRNPQRQDVILPSNGDELVLVAESTTVVHKTNRYLERQNPIPSIGKKVTQTTDQEPVLRNACRNPEIQGTTFPLNRIASTQRTKITTVFPNAFSKLEKQNSVLPSNREERIQRANLDKVLENVHRNEEIQATSLPSSTEHTQTTVENIYRNQETISATVFENSYKNQETLNTIILSYDEEEKLKSENVINVKKDVSPNEIENKQLTNSATVFENSYENKETQNIILLSYDEEHKEIKSENDINIENVSLSKCCSNNIQIETKTEIEKSILLSKEDTQINSVLKNIDIEDEFCSYDDTYKQIIKQENNIETRLEENSKNSLKQHDKLKIEVTNCIDKNTSSNDKQCNNNVNNISTKPVEIFGNKSLSSNIALEDSLLSKELNQQNFTIDKIEDFIPFNNKADRKFYQDLVKIINSESITNKTTIPVFNYEFDIETHNLEPTNNFINKRKPYEQKEIKTSKSEICSESKRLKQETNDSVPLSTENHLQENSNKSITNISNNRREIEDQIRIPEVVDTNSEGLNKEIEASYQQTTTKDFIDINDLVSYSRPEEYMKQTVGNYNYFPEDEHMQLNDIDIKDDSFEKNSANDFVKELKLILNSEQASLASDKTSDKTNPNSSSIERYGIFNIRDVKSFYQELENSITSKTIQSDYNTHANNFVTDSEISNDKIIDENSLLIVKCPICPGPEYISKSELHKHLTWHKDKTYYECSICNKKLKVKTWSAYKRHAKIHRNSKNLQNSQTSFQCSFCKRKYKSKIFFDRHVKVHVEGKKKDINCTLCDKKFAHERDLRFHMLYHTEEKKYECSICGKKILYAKHVALHERIHRKKVYTCNICNKTFAWFNNLWLHKKIHEGTKKFECNICNKKFLHNTHLKQHTLTHTGIKDHVCSVCDKAFALPGSLRKHMETHNKAKSHKGNRKLKSDQKIKPESETEAETETEDDNSCPETEDDNSCPETEDDNSCPESEINNADSLSE